MYTGVYSSEKLPSTKKINIDKKNLILRLPDLEEDVVYVTNKYICLLKNYLPLRFFLIVTLLCFSVYES